MSMTREEAIRILKNGGIEVCGETDRISEFIAALGVALDALIPPTREDELEAENRELKERIVNWRNYMAPTREQVEKAWRGDWIAVRPEFAGHDHIGGYKCSRCKEEAVLDCNDEFVLDNFCPRCGAAMTDEAVEITMRRLEAIFR